MAQGSGEIAVPISELTRKWSLKITLTGVKVWTFRMGFALVILRLAAWISPLPFVIGHGKTDLPR